MMQPNRAGTPYACAWQSMLLALASCVLWCGAAVPCSAQAKTIKVGFINSLTGPEAPIGENLTNGVLLALDDLKARGVNVELIKQDDLGKPQIAMSAMEQLVTGDEVSAVLGPYTSANSNAVAKLAQQYKVPQLVPVASKDDITRHGQDYVFRINAISTQYARSLIDAALLFGHPKRIAFIYESADFGMSVSTAGKLYAHQKGLKVVADEAYQKGAPDYRSTLTKIKAAEPDLVFMVSYVADAILLMRQSREIGLNPEAFLGGGAGFENAQFEAERDISNLVYSVTQWTADIDWPGAADFGKRYQTRFGKKASYHAACAYASMMLLGETAARVGGDRKRVRDALASGSWQTILGDVKFESYDGFTQQNRHELAVIQYQGGKSTVVYPPAYAKAKPVYPFPGWSGHKENPQMFSQAAISGILIGGVYALIGIGLTIIFGVMQVINFAHGDLVMVGMYITWLLFTRFHVDPFASVLVTAPLLFGLGVVIQRVFIQRVARAAAENQILLTIGLGLLLSNTVMLLFTSDYQILSTSYSSSSFSIAGASVSKPLTYAFLVTLLVASALYVFLMKTDTGQAIRATAQDREAAQLMGINVSRMSRLAFGIGAALAGTAGALIAPTYYIFPQVGHAFNLKSFVIVVLGGMGSVVGAMLGGILIGVIESVAALYLPAGLKEAVVFALFLLLLLFRPSGLLGRART